MWQAFLSCFKASTITFFIFPNNVHIFCLYCNVMYAKIFFILHTKRQKHWENIVEFPFGCLQFGPCLTNVYCTWLYIRQVDFIIYEKPWNIMSSEIQISILLFCANYETTKGIFSKFRKLASMNKSQYFIINFFYKHLFLIGLVIYEEN